MNDEAFPRFLDLFNHRFIQFVLPCLGGFAADLAARSSGRRPFVRLYRFGGRNRISTLPSARQPTGRSKAEFCRPAWKRRRNRPRASRPLFAEFRSPGRGRRVHQVCVSSLSHSNGRASAGLQQVRRRCAAGPQCVQRSGQDQDPDFFQRIWPNTFASYRLAIFASRWPTWFSSIAASSSNDDVELAIPAGPQSPIRLGQVRSIGLDELDVPQLDEQGGLPLGRPLPSCRTHEKQAKTFEQGP